MIVIGAVGLVIVLLLGWAANLLGLPGNWVNVVAVALYAWWIPDDRRLAIGWWVVGAVLVLALVGELLEFAAEALGAARRGGSRRGVIGALVGSFAGGLLGAVVGVPIPLFGPLIGIVLFGGVGALAGAVLSERSGGRDWNTSWQIGRAAFWGRLLGTAGKIGVGGVIVVVVVAAMLFG